MKKYIHVFENKIVYREEREVPSIFGGPWAKAIIIEVPEFMDVQTVQIEIQDDEIVLKEAE